MADTTVDTDSPWEESVRESADELYDDEVPAEVIRPSDIGRDTTQVQEPISPASARTIAQGKGNRQPRALFTESLELALRQGKAELALGHARDLWKARNPESKIRPREHIRWDDPLTKLLYVRPEDPDDPNSFPVRSVFRVRSTYRPSPVALKRIVVNRNNNEEMRSVSKELILVYHIHPRLHVMNGIHWDDEPADFQAQLKNFSFDNPRIKLALQPPRKNEQVFWVWYEFSDSDLRRQLNSAGRPAVHTGLVWSVQIAAGMHYLHEKHVAHRDLKPDNVLLKRLEWMEPELPDQLVAVVSDFGLCSIGSKSTAEIAVSNAPIEKRPELKKKLAESLDRLSHPTMLHGSGTTSFMAPEVLSNQYLTDAEPKSYSHKVDTYSFGICLFEMFTGRSAFSHISSSLSPIHHPNSFAEAIQKRRKEGTVFQHGHEQHWWKAPLKTGRPARLKQTNAEHMRPWFYEADKFLPLRLVKLIQSCWSNNPNDRPDFPKIVRELHDIIIEHLVSQAFEQLSQEQHDLARAIDCYKTVLEWGHFDFSKYAAEECRSENCPKKYCPFVSNLISVLDLVKELTELSDLRQSSQRRLKWTTCAPGDGLRARAADAEYWCTHPPVMPKKSESETLISTSLSNAVELAANLLRDVAGSLGK